MFNKKEYQKEYRKTHKKQIKEYKNLHKEEIKKYNEEYYSNYYEINKYKIIKNQKEYTDNHKIEYKKYQKEYRNNNKKELNEYHKKYAIEHKEKLRQYKKEYMRNRCNTDIDFKILCNLRGRLSHTLRGNFKLETTMNLVGCSIDQLKQHLESNFKPGMSWNNYGTGKNGKGMQEWHIDHIKPCASFDLSNPEEQTKCFHYTNLQPLWAEENLTKNDKYKGVI